MVHSRNNIFLSNTKTPEEIASLDNDFVFQPVKMKQSFNRIQGHKQQLLMTKLFKTQAYLGNQFTSSAYQQFVYGFRKKMAIIHLDSTLRCLRRACRFLTRCMLASKSQNNQQKSKRCELFFVNENPEYNTLVKYTAKELNQNYSNDKWVGGLLTNWDHIQVVYEEFQNVCFNLKESSTQNAVQNSDLFLLQTLPRFQKWKQNFEGLISTNRPDCMISLNGNQNSIAIKEANCLGIPIIALIDSNISKDLQKAVGYPIPGNVESMELVYIICNSVVKSVKCASLRF